jgi:hypothetical protein
VVGSDHRRSIRKLASSTRILCIYLDNKRLGHKCPCKSQGGALYRTVRRGAVKAVAIGQLWERRPSRATEQGAARWRHL